MCLILYYTSILDYTILDTILYYTIYTILYYTKLRLCLSQTLRNPNVSRGIGRTDYLLTNIMDSEV